MKDFLNELSFQHHDAGAVWVCVCICVLSLEWIEKRLSLYSGSTPRNSEIYKTISWDSRDESLSNNKDIKS